MNYPRNKNVPHDTEDKQWWLIHGENLEHQFVAICQKRLNLDVAINPDKEHDPTLPDLVYEGRLADLKCQYTPFFTAHRYGLDPRHTVTFNRKDYERYRKLYPDLHIFFWVDWKQLYGFGASIDYLGGFFSTPFKKIQALIESGAPEHSYQRRKWDTRGNAKSSFLLDLKEFNMIFEAGG